MGVNENQFITASIGILTIILYVRSFFPLNKESYLFNLSAWAVFYQGFLMIWSAQDFSRECYLGFGAILIVPIVLAINEVNKNG